MSALDRGTLANELSRLGPYLGHTLERGAQLALRFHAQELATEHVLAAMLADEDCAATRLVLHAFADPETIAIEVLALSEGIMVVSAERCLPFSPRGVRLLEDARADAAERGHAAVEVAHLARAAVDQLDAGLVAELAAAGWDAEAATAGLERSDDPVPAGGPVLERLTHEARRALLGGARYASAQGRPALAPAHVLVGGLEVSGPLGGLTASRVRQLIRGRDEDPSSPEGRALAPGDALRGHLEALADGGDTAAFLARLVHAGSSELRALLGRQKITPALVEHARGAFGDPETP